MDLNQTIVINAPTTVVWTLLTDFDQMRRWMPDVVSCEVRSPGPLRAGLVSDMKITEGKKVVDYVSEIVTHEPQTRLTVRLSGGSLGKGPMDIDYRIVSDENSTTVHINTTWKPHGIVLSLMSPLINVLGKRNTATVMTRLKDLAESESGA